VSRTNPDTELIIRETMCGFAAFGDPEHLELHRQQLRLMASEAMTELEARDHVFDWKEK
jgi:hypothetical protein